MKIGYFGDGIWAHGALAKILEDKSMQVGFVCARNDNPDAVLRQMAEKVSIPFITHKNINSSDFIARVKTFACDIFVSMSFNQIFKNEIMGVPPMHIINCHAGKLPFYRGRNILNWAVINDEKEFGITVHYVDSGIDTGDIVLQESYPIKDSDTYKTLLERAHTACPELLYEALKQIISGKSHQVKQRDIHPVGFYCTQRRAGDEILDWNQNSRAVFNFIRAICKPGPMALSYVGGEKVYLNRAEMIPSVVSYVGIPGAVLEAGADYLIVKTRDSFIKVSEWECLKRIKTGDRLCQKSL